MADLYRWTCSCGAEQGMTVETNRVLRSSSATFYCVHGHRSHYPQGESAEDKLRRERDRLKQDAARLQQEIDYQREHRQAAERRASAYKGQATRIRKRAVAGTCPCCSRTFASLARHMATQHPDFTPEPTEAENG